MMDSAQSTLGNLVEDGKKRKGALVQLVDMVEELHENEIIQDRDESNRMVKLAKKSRKDIESSLRDVKGAQAQQRADAAVQDVPLDQLMQLVECANGAYEAMATQVNLLREMEKSLNGKWKELPEAQKIGKMRQGLSKVLCGLDSKDVRRQRHEFEKIKRANQAERGGPAPAPGEKEEEEEHAAVGPEIDSDNEFGAADLVEESVRPVFVTRGASAVAGA